jgi:plastocyanin
MTRITLSCLVVAGISASLFLVPASAMTHPQLTGMVGKNDAYAISLKNASGKLVKTLKAGSYTFVIHDDSALHSFGLDGPHGFAKDFTTVAFKGTKTATVALKKGKYKYYCQAHESTMYHFFAVG